MIKEEKTFAAAKRLKHTTEKAALRAVEKLLDVLDNPESSNADVLKAATLIFDRIYPGQAGGDAGAGDYEICVKEE